MPTAQRHTRVIVWMRRALRVQDNSPLWNAIKEAREVIPVVCLREHSRYQINSPRRQYLRSALLTLDRQLRERGSRLYVRQGPPEEEIPAAASEYGAEAVYAVRVYDPRTLRRDASLASSLGKIGVRWETFQDGVLFEGKQIVSGSGQPYKVYTPYMRAWRERWDDAPRKLPAVRTFFTPALRTVELRALPGFSDAPETGGEQEAQKRLRRFIGDRIQVYRQTRDLPGTDGTSRLSADLANGTLSIRTVYWAAREAREKADRKGKESVETFINELIWREFYYQILANYPFVADGAFREELREIPWLEKPGQFEAWAAGLTGFPIVDAAMRQLNTDGWMHNRARMIVASFLTKDLHITWQRGEKHFSERLVDLDIASNNGGWQWVAGTGTDASPYFRVFNPVLQAKNFDPEGVYVRTYVPELARVPARWIHEPWRLGIEDQKAAGCVIGKDYPVPIVDHGTERQVALRLYKRATTNGSTSQRASGR